MKIFGLLLILCCTVFKAGAQSDCASTFRGTKTLYMPADTSALKAPAGYMPFFLNYVGRHGARHPTNLKELNAILKTLGDADSASALTDDGSRLLRIMKTLQEVERHYTPGDITAHGVAELSGIGRRMGARYPFVKSGKVTLRTTPQARTRQSARALFTGLELPYPGGAALDEWDSVRLRFYDISPAYLRLKERGGAWEASVAQLMGAPKTTAIVESITLRWFRKDYADKLLAQKAKKDGTLPFVLSVFGIAAIEQGMHAEIESGGHSYNDADIIRLMHCNEMEWLEVVADAEDFLLKGPGTDVAGIQVKIAAPLLLDLITSTDSAIMSGISGASFRLSHAETIAPLAALMGISGAATPAKDVMQYEKVWQAATVIPFSANIQWVIYHSANKLKTPLVVFMHNEHAVRIPLPAKAFPFYEWSDVRKYYIAKLAGMGLAPGADSYKWLKKLQ